MFRVGDKVVLDPNSRRLLLGKPKTTFEEFCSRFKVLPDTVYTVVRAPQIGDVNSLMEIRPMISGVHEWYANRFMPYIEDPVEMSVRQLSMLIRKG